MSLLLIQAAATGLFTPSLAESQMVGQMRFDTIVAPSLKDNLVGDSNRRAVSIYLPPTYEIERARRYPVVYLLHGVDADNLAFIKGAYEKLNIRLAMDSLIATGVVKEMIVVTPNARNVYDGSFYANSAATGNWEDFIVKDFVAYMDSHYRTIADRSGRGIAGHSMGGYGALRLG
ncbi:MAG: alpha/beta hydrolase, partial [Thermoanaerobaculia bacterium]